MDPSITSKIRKFIAVAPPFAGADELIDVYLNGMHGFDFEIKIGKVEIFKVNYDVFGQYMFYKAVPIITELRPQPFINELFTSILCKGTQCEIHKIIWRRYFPFF